MKPFLISVAVFTSLLCLSGCSTSTPVMAAAGGVYTVTKTGTTGFTPLGNLRIQAYKEANEFAANKGMVAEVVSVNETAAGFVKWPQVDLKFRLVLTMGARWSEFSTCLYQTLKLLTVPV